MKRNKSLLSYILIISIFIGLGVYLFQLDSKRSVVMSIAPPPVSIPSSPSPVILSQISPDGTHTVSLKKDGTQTDVIVNNLVVVTRFNDPVTELSIPFNTWSPDDKYFFLKEVKDGINEYIVMNKTGKVFADDSPYLKVASLFAQAHPETTLVDVTGWAAPTLLILNAKSASETNMSFWFDVQTHKFIRLSNFFY